MRKAYRFMTVVISLLVVFAVCSGSAFACTTSKIVQNADMRIQQQIDTRVMIAGKSASADKIENTTDRLITNTDRIAAQSADLAAKNGDVIISEYIEVNVGGSIVLVDPVRMY